MTGLKGTDLIDLTPASLAAFREKLTPEARAHLESLGGTLQTYLNHIARARVGSTSVGVPEGAAHGDTHLSISGIDQAGAQFSFKFPTDGGAPLISYARPDNPGLHEQVKGDTSQLLGVRALADILRVASTNGFTVAEKTLLTAMGNQVLVANGILPQPRGAAR